MSAGFRKVKQIMTGRPTLEGAGVRLKRVFGFNEVPLFDPFLLFDDFHSDNPQDYIAGFPWHPHRGIETVTYLLQGQLRHGDSMGNRGVIQAGDIQWMTAGGGIIHEEMPEQKEGLLWGFQLWANLPASHKMINPRYQDISAGQVPEVSDDSGRVRVIAGTYQGVPGAVRDIVTDPHYLDVTLEAGKQFTHDIPEGHTVFAYCLEGAGFFEPQAKKEVQPGQVVLYGDGFQLRIQSQGPLRFLLVSGKPLGEPVAWQGPIVMNSQAELDLAFQEYRDGTFIKNG